MQLRKEQTAHFIKQIRETIAYEPCAHDEITQARISEVIEVLALGCTLQRPRTFRGQQMTADDFIKIAKHITLSKIAVAVNSMIKNSATIQNRTWYIMGVLSRY